MFCCCWLFVCFMCLWVFLFYLFSFVVLCLTRITLRFLFRGGLLVHPVCTCALWQLSLKPYNRAGCVMLHCNDILCFDVNNLCVLCEVWLSCSLGVLLLCCLS